MVSVFTRKWILIRFNGDSRNTAIKTRLYGLNLEIDKQIARINNDENRDLLDIVKLYFDSDSD